MSSYLTNVGRRLDRRKKIDCSRVVLGHVIRKSCHIWTHRVQFQWLITRQRLLNTLVLMYIPQSWALFDEMTTYFFH